MIELRHLRYFVVVAEELHFGRAAERLHMAQSPLSHQIRQLERTLGVELINRGHHVVGLTDAGRVFFQAALQVLQEVDEAVRDARRADRGEVGVLTIGYVSEVTADLLPLTLKAFRQECPDVEVDLRQGMTGELLEDLREGRADVVFARSPRSHGDIEYEQLVEEALVAALPEEGFHGADCHYVSGSPCALGDLASEPFVLAASNSAFGLRRDIEDACAASGFEPNVVREASPLTSVVLMVAAGAGVSLLPASVSHAYPVPGVRYVPLEGRPTTTAGMAWRRNDPSRIVANFLDVTRRRVAARQGQRDVWPERRVSDPEEPADPSR